jgi:hypothetical protein
VAAVEILTIFHVKFGCVLSRFSLVIRLFTIDVVLSPNWGFNYVLW